MSEYLLPCSCGQNVVVSTRHAGHTVQCVCGATLEVPTLRGLRDLAPATAAGSARAGSAAANWSGRHRLIYSLTLISLAALAASAFWYTRLPEPIVRPTREQIDEAFEHVPAPVAFAMLEELKSQGLLPPGTLPNNNQRQTMLAGLTVLAGLGVCGLLGALVLAVGGRRAPQRS